MSEDYTGFGFMYEAQVIIMVRSPIQSRTTCFITHGVFTERDIVFPCLRNFQLIKLCQQLGMFCGVL